MNAATPRVDFYILSASGAGARLNYACRLAEKVYKLDTRVHAHVSGAAQARQLDELLWTFSKSSFIPHEISGKTAEQPAPVTIGHASEVTLSGDLLINLDETIPPFFDQFSRVAEIIDSDPESKKRGRERFSIYRDNGYEIKTHNL